MLFFLFLFFVLCCFSVVVCCVLFAKSCIVRFVTMLMIFSWWLWLLDVSSNEINYCIWPVPVVCCVCAFDVGNFAHGHYGDGCFFLAVETAICFVPMSNQKQ